jgi:CheY-like chemotaxis protein
VSDWWLKANGGELGRLSDCKRLIVTTTDARESGDDFIYLKKPFRYSQLLAVLHGAPGQSQRIALPSDSLRKRRFLVVEDNLVNQQIMSATLMRLGAEVDLADNGELGLEAMKVKDYDLIFMDGQMPVMDGYECTLKLREYEEGTGDHRIIVATTASERGSDQEDCLRCGMDAYVAKPITRTALLAVIQGLLDDWHISA